MTCLLFAVGLPGLTSPASAIGTCWRTEQIPSERLVENLKEKAAARPNDANAQYQLARAYVVSAYRDEVYRLYKVDGEYVTSCKTGSFQFDGKWRNWSYWNPYYGAYGPDAFPTQAEERILWNYTCSSSACKIDLAHDKEALRNAARQHIEQAIVHYERAIELKPDLLFKLGLGWALDVLGEEQRAKEVYREVIKASWPAERNQKWKQGGPEPDVRPHLDSLDYDMTRFITYEAGYYLAALLDPGVDAKELTDIQRKLIRLAQNGVGGGDLTPMIIPLNRSADLGELVDQEHYVRFNMDGLGVREWQWITSKAGLLVFVGDEDNPTITSGHQLFGNVTFHNFWRTGYEALASLDDNRDGWLKSEELIGIAVWHDKNQDGKSTPSELLTLEELGIVAIATKPAGPADGKFSNPAGIQYVNGKLGPSFDWISHLRSPEMN